MLTPTQRRCFEMSIRLIRGLTEAHSKEIDGELEILTDLLNQIGTANDNAPE